MVSTPNLWLASFLHAQGQHVAKAERMSGKVFFHFDLTAEEFQRARANFDAGATVSARRFASAHTDLKNMIFDTLHGLHGDADAPETA